jgi:hypothetical protein
MERSLMGSTTVLGVKRRSFDERISSITSDELNANIARPEAIGCDKDSRAPGST